MGLTGRRALPGGGGKTRAFCGFAIGVIGLFPIVASSPAHSLELSAPQAALYSTVSIFPPSAQRMTVCYGFVCRRREILDFTAGDRSALLAVASFMQSVQRSLQLRIRGPRKSRRAGRARSAQAQSESI